MLTMLTNDKNAEIIKQGPNVFFKKNGFVIGFNIFNFPNIETLPNGRCLVTKDLIDLLEETYRITLDKSNLAFFVVGKVVECSKIEGTHLSKCLVDIDSSNYLQIVCGANNVRENLMVVVATIGIIMNNGILISPTKLKGIDSFGMLCSQKELDITGFNDNGIIELTNGKYHIGQIFKECYIDYDFK